MQPGRRAELTMDDIDANAYQPFEREKRAYSDSANHTLHRLAGPALRALRVNPVIALCM